MKIVSILREAGLNIAAGTTRAALFAAVLAVIMVVLGGAEIATIANIDHQAVEFRQTGGSTLIYRMKNGINAGACDSFRTMSGVTAAGAIRQRDTGEVATALPTQEIPSFEISPGFGNFQALGNVRNGDGVLISEDLSNTLGARAGQALRLVSGKPHVGGIFAYPADGRQPGYGYSILTPTDTNTRYDECWVEAWPISDRLLAILPTSLLPGAVSTTSPGTQGPQLQQLNASHGAHFDGATLFDNRITRFAPILATIIGIALGFVSTVRRKLELAAARHAGVTFPAQALQIAAETVTWAAIATVIALPVITSLITLEATTAAASLGLFAAGIILSAAPAAVVGAIAGTLLIRERHLFAYFKSR